jgi:CHASE3 domain sensor protein
VAQSRKISLLVIALLVLLVGTLAFSYVAVDRQQEFQQKLYKEADRAVQIAWELESIANDLRITKRGFLLSGEQELLKTFFEDIGRFNVVLKEAQELVAKDAEQVARLKRIDTAMTRWVEESARPEIQKRMDLDAGRATVGDIELMIKAGTGQAFSDNAKQEFDLLISALKENARAQNLRAQREALVLRIVLSIAFFAALSALVAVITLAVTQRSRGKRD